MLGKRRDHDALPQVVGLAGRAENDRAVNDEGCVPQGYETIRIQGAGPNEMPG